MAAVVANVLKLRAKASGLTMKYTFDVQTSAQFIHIISQPEPGDSMAAPRIAQVRADPAILRSLLQAVEEAECTAKLQEQGYHDDPQLARNFDNGVCVFKPGELPVTLVMQRRRFEVLVGTQQVLTQASDFKGLKVALSKALKAC